MKKILSLVLALSLCLCMGVTAFAAEIDTSGGSGTTPVSLTTTNNGIGGGEGGDGGDVTPTKLNVVVPTALPMAMSDDGTVVTATDCKVINNSYGAVRIKSVTITAANDWHLTAFGDKASLAGEKVDSNKLGFAMSIGGGDVTPTKLNVVVPTALPMAMSDDGTVVTATDCKVINNSYGAVRIKSVTITAANDWHLTAFGDKASLAGEKVDSNKLGFALSIGGGSQVKTASDAATQALISAPIAGCFMTGIGDTAHNFAPIDYAAIVTPLSSAVSNATVANIVIVVEWDTVS